jgi:hypothetical protein
LEHPVEVARSPLTEEETGQVARASVAFSVGQCAPVFLQWFLALAVEDERPGLATKLRRLSQEQVRALRTRLAESNGQSYET